MTNDSMLEFLNWTNISCEESIKFQNNKFLIETCTLDNKKKFLYVFDVFYKKTILEKTYVSKEERFNDFINLPIWGKNKTFYDAKHLIEFAEYDDSDE